MRFRYRFPALSVLVACCLLLPACGNKGSLTLPPKDDAAATNKVKQAPDHNSQPAAPR
jgi:predicted small lipoprotein YifL